MQVLVPQAQQLLSQVELVISSTLVKSPWIKVLAESLMPLRLRSALTPIQCIRL